MKKKPILISGINLCGKMSGIPRYIAEITTRIDNYMNNSTIDIRLCYPEGSKLLISELKRIKMVPIKNDGKRWMSQTLFNYAKKTNGIVCNMASGLDKNKNGIAMLHDVRPLERKYDSIRTRISECVRYHYIRKNAAVIVTVSEFQKKIIEKHFPNKRVEVISPGWEHLENIQEDSSILAQLEAAGIKAETYYYAIGSLDMHKNYKWIIEIAKKNPEKHFVIAGIFRKETTGFSELKNIYYVGYITDSENKTLMKHCKALLCPSKYEGFGLTPLEALSLGKPVALSNIDVFKEIYCGVATYFDPDDYDFNLDMISKPNAEKVSEKLKYYSWNKSAKKWLELFGEFNNEDTSK